MDKRKIIMVIAAIVAGILGLRYMRKKGKIPAIPFIAPDEPIEEIDKPTAIGETARSVVSSITGTFKEGLNRLRRTKVPKIPRINWRLGIKKLKTKATSATYSIRKRVRGASGKLYKKSRQRLSYVRRSATSKGKTHVGRTYRRIAKRTKLFRKRTKGRFTRFKKSVLKARRGVGRTLGRVKGRVSKLRRRTKRRTRSPTKRRAGKRTTRKRTIRSRISRRTGRASKRVTGKIRSIKGLFRRKRRR